TSEIIFEQDAFEKNIAVIGTGVIGIELGQALARFGLNITAFSHSNNLGGLTDPSVNTVAQEILAKEIKLCLNNAIDLTQKHDQLTVRAKTKDYKVDQVLVAVGRQANLAELGL